MSNYIEIKLQFPAKDSVGLSLKEYLSADMQLIITNLYKPNQYVILNKGNIPGFDEGNMRLTAQIPVDDNYTTDDYKAAGIRLIMNTPLAPEHSLYTKAKKIGFASSSFYDGGYPYKGPFKLDESMYDSGSGNNTKWHFTIKSPSTNSIASDVLSRKLAKTTYHKFGNIVQRQLDNYTAYLNINKKINQVVLEFHTPDKDEKGTDSYFAIYLLGKKFIISADNGGGFWPLYKWRGSSLSEEQHRGNIELFMAKFKCAIKTKPDNGKRFERNTTDTITITLPPESDYHYYDLLKSDISIKMEQRKPKGNQAWSFDSYTVKYGYKDENEDENEDTQYKTLRHHTTHESCIYTINDENSPAIFLHKGVLLANKKIKKIALQFHTSTKDKKGTDSFFAISIPTLFGQDKKLIFSACDRSTFWPLDNDHEVSEMLHKDYKDKAWDILTQNQKLKKAGFKCTIESQDPTRRFEKGTTDTVVIHLPDDSDYNYYNLLTKNISIKMECKHKNNNQQWTFDEYRVYYYEEGPAGTTYHKVFINQSIEYTIYDTRTDDIVLYKGIEYKIANHLQYSDLKSKIAEIEHPILKKYRNSNYFIHTIAFTFRTHEEVHSGTNAIFKISVFGESFLFNTKTGKVTGSHFEGKIVSNICPIDSYEWIENKDEIFEERSLDKILIKLPENTYSYNDFVATDVKLKMVDENGDGPGWKFKYCEIDLFKESPDPDPDTGYQNYENRYRINNDNNIGSSSGFIYFGQPPVYLYKANSLSPLPNNTDKELYNDIFDKKVKKDLTIDEPQIKYRIEPYVRNIDTDNINNALSMAIHDPLWLLARQWQFGEFKGNDAGSVILAKLKAKKTKVNQLYNLDKPSQATNIKDMPLEPMVEALPIEIDWQARVESAHYFLSMLQFNTHITTNLATLKAELLSNFPLASVTSQTTGNLSPEEHLEQLKTACKTDLQAYVSNYQNKIFDGYKLYQWCVNNITKPKKNLKLLQDDAEILNMLKEYMAWFEKKYHIEPNTYWKPEALNYRFGVQSTADNTNLVADNYDSGKLSWFSFEDDADKNKSSQQNKGTQATTNYEEKLFTFIPTMAQYPGMPKKRLWELESGTVEMGVTTGVGVKHYANALILQYATMYANDWMMLPMELDISTITEVDKVLLTNVFGDRILIRAKDKTNPNERFMNNWDMFSLSRKDPYLNNNFSSDKRMLYPPALYNGMESEPIEEIQFLRDEMSNMMWGVENIINQGCGISLDGKHFAAALEEKIEEQNTQPQQQNNDTDAKNPDYAYTFQNTVPANWIPFIPVRLEKGATHYEREIRLQRAKMPIYLDNKYVAMQPNTSFLQSGLKGENYAPLFINEEEIDAVGAKLIKTYQRVRWIGGKIFTWTGYKKQLIGTQANSGLKFDKLEEIEKDKA